MKRILLILLAVCGINAALVARDIRMEVRFLTDKMAYELGLGTTQYNDVFEINYDFLMAIDPFMLSVSQGDPRMLERFYDYLDIRNDELRYVMNKSQYARFIKTDDFFRPITFVASGWELAIYGRYANARLFFYPRPVHYLTYCGAHYRMHYHNHSYYSTRYSHTRYPSLPAIRKHHPPRPPRRPVVSKRPPRRPVVTQHPPHRPQTGVRPEHRPQAGKRPEAGKRPVRQEKRHERQEGDRQSVHSNRR